MSNLSQYLKKLTTGKIAVILTLVHVLSATLWVYYAPLSRVAFFYFITAFFTLYAMSTSKLFKFSIAMVIALVVVPIIGIRNIFYLEIIFQMSVFSALALGLNIVVGFAGLLDLGYVAFYAVGAYLWAFFGSQQYFVMPYPAGTAPAGLPFLLPGNAFFLFLFLGIIAAAITGIILGLPVLRLRGDYLAIVTLGFGEVIRVLANNMDKPVNITNGPQGITPIQRPTIPQFAIDSFNAVFGGITGKQASLAEMYNVFFYLLALVVIIIIILVANRLNDSKVGRAWAAIRDDETAAIAMGIPLVKMKLTAFAIGASFAGVMGVLLASFRTFISPETFNFMQSIGVLTMVILGGAGSIQGVILGAIVVVLLNLQVLQGLSLYLSQLRQSDAVIPIINFAWKDLSNQLDPSKYQKLLFGFLLIVMMIFRPGGLIPMERKKRKLLLEESDETKSGASQ
ncbi:MAG TPA: hypothetical protein VN226_09700 [Anaerolineales bacterium]|nr:hypothetical protein [Anaerolineales bacterium]